jgi:hypothetical protein
VARSDGRLQQVKRPSHVDIDKGAHVIARDVWLVESRGMDNRFDAIIREGALDHCSVCHRADDLSVGTRRNVQTDRDMPGRTQSRSEKSAEPSGRTGKEDAHYKSLSSSLQRRVERTRNREFFGWPGVDQFAMLCRPSVCRR